MKDNNDETGFDMVSMDPQGRKNEIGDIKLDWKKIPSLMAIKGELDEALPYHNKQMQLIRNWLDNLHCRGKAKPKHRPGRSQVAPKLIRKQAEWRYSSLSEPFIAPVDLFKASPVTFDDKNAALQNQLVLNHQFTYRIDRGAFIDEYVRAAVDTGTVIVKVGWCNEEVIEFEEQATFELVPDETFGPELEQLVQLSQTNLNAFEYDVPHEMKEAVVASQQAQFPMRPIVTGSEEIEVPRIIKNQPTLEVCDTRNVVIDPTCNGKLEDAKTIWYSFEASIADLEKDDRYFNLDKVNVKNNTVLSDVEHHATDGAKNFNFRDGKKNKIVVRECWTEFDIDGDGVMIPILLSWIGDTYVRMELNPYPDQMHPFESAEYMPVSKSVYGEPDGELLEENQQIIGAVTRGMIDILGRSANAQTGVAANFLDAANKRRMERGEDYVYNINADPRQSVYMHKFEEIPQSAQFMLNQQNAEAESLTGVKAFYGGLNGDSLGDVATSVKGVLDSAARRELGILRRLAGGIIRIGRKVAAMNGEFLSETEVVRLTNEQFVPIRRDELNGEFDLKLTISSADEDNIKAQELAFMLQTMGNNIDFGITKLVLMDMFRLRKMPDLAKAIENYEPQPDPVQQQIQQLEIAKLQAEIELIQSQVVENQAEAQLDQAKIGTEQAKAGQMQADSDNKSLEFVERETGVTQERDIERQKAQAQGNIELERAKRQLDREDANRLAAQEQQKELTKQFLKTNSDDASDRPQTTLS